MSSNHTNTAHSNTACSSLSVDAAVFVPTKFSDVAGDDSVPAASATTPAQRDGGDGGGCGGGQRVAANSDAVGEEGGKPLMEVPPYITNCYPFVNPNITPRHPGKTYLASGSRPFLQQSQPCYHGGNMRQRYPLNQGLQYPHPHPHPQHQWMGNPQPAHVTPSLVLGPLPGGVGIPSTGVGTLPGGVGMPFDGGTGTLGPPTTGSLGTGLLPTPPLGDGLLPTPPYPPLSLPTVLGAGSGSLVPKGVQYLAGLPMGASPHILLRADGKKVPAASAGTRRGSGRGAKVSTGTQKETHKGSHGRPWGHTIIMKDNCVQTDFHTDIADLTLCEKASVLYRRGQRKNKGSQPHVSTDSEEVDSDSGYSSPLHRRNLVSNGTHPVRINALLEAADNSRRNHNNTATATATSLRPPPPPPSLAGEGRAGKGTLVEGRRSASDASVGVMYTRRCAVAGDRQGGQLEPRTQTDKKKKKADRDGLSGDGQLTEAERGEGQPSGDSSLPASMVLTAGSEPADVQCVGGATLPLTQNMQHAQQTLQAHSWGSKRPEGSQSVSVQSGASKTPQTPQTRAWGSNRQNGQASDCGATMGQKEDALAHRGKEKDNACVGHASTQGWADTPAGSTQKAAVTVATIVADTSKLSAPDFPVLRPAKRNEPPWSLSPHSHRSKVIGDGASVGGSGGVGTCTVKSYASIVKSAVSSGSAWSPAQQAVTVTSVDGGERVNLVVTAGESLDLEEKCGDCADGDDSIRTKQRCDTWADRARPAHSTTSQPAGGGGGKSTGGGGGKPLIVTQRTQVPPPPSAHGERGQQLVGWPHNQCEGNTECRGQNVTLDLATRNRHNSPAGGASGGGTGNQTKSRQSSPVPDSSGQTDRHRPQQGHMTDDDGKSEKEEEGKKRPRRRRHRRRRRKAKLSEDGLSDGLSGMERTVSSSNISRTSDVTLHFDDDLEFPDVSTANASGSLDNLPMPRVDSVSSLSYSDILKRKPTMNDVRSRTQSAPGSCLSGEEGGDENFSSQPGQGSVGLVTMSRRARKRRKRRELANRAAEAELAEISLEQQMLRELGHKVSSSRPGSGTREERSASRHEKSPSRGLITDQNIVNQSKVTGQGQSGKRLHQPIALNIADMLDAFEKKKTLDQLVVLKKMTSTGKEDIKLNHNILDASAPAKRGKEREMPKTKKPSPLKKVILKEREEKKRMRLIDDCEMYPGVDLADNPPDEMLEDTVDNLESVENNTGNPVALGDSDLSQDALSSRSVDTDQGVSPGADLSPISQTSPLSMSPLTPGASPLNSPIAGGLSRDPVVLRIHSRRFREYCTQILDKDIDACCTSLLHELVRFQDRMYHKDPTKAKSKRRIVLGLREVTKHLKLKKIKCVIISPNLEKIQSKGGLDEALNNILTMCQDQNVPFVFALGRRALGRACAKLVPVSVAGIFNYEGCEDKFNHLISLTHKGREAYEEMKQAVEREIAENPPPSMMSTGSSMPNLFAHMGHSRTPSGCSAISFTSSVLSEPISENYPHAEPETDSKGFEIVRDVGSCLAQGHTAYHHGNGGTLTGSYHTSVEDIDDGNEADVEDLSDNPRRKKGGGGGGKRGGGEEKTVVVVGALRGVGGDNEPQQLDAKLVHKDEVETEGLAVVVETGGLAVAADRKETSEDEHSESECDSQRELPHIDSIHNSMYDLSTEILSQHSSRTIDNSEVLSTHSSRTLGESSVPLTNPDRLRHDGQRTPDGVRQTSPVRLMNSDRIQNWVEATQLCLQDMSGTSHVATPVTDDDDDDDEFVEAREMLKDTSDSDTDTENKLT